METTCYWMEPHNWSLLKFRGALSFDSAAGYGAEARRAREFNLAKVRIRGGGGGSPVGAIRKTEQEDGEFFQKPVAASITGQTAVPERGSETQGRVLALYDEYNASLYRYLRSLGLSPDGPEDVMQEVFLRLTDHFIAGAHRDSNLRSWLFQVAHNCSMDLHRRRRRDMPFVRQEEEAQQEPIDPHGDPERMYIQKERMENVSRAMSGLTQNQRQSVLLRAEGLKYWEIAHVLGVSEQRAVHLVKRGLIRLAEAI